MTVALAKAMELGYDVVACASTGNPPTRWPPVAAAGLESYVFIPADLEEQKILATGIYGTHLVAVRGNYDDVNRLCTQLSGERPWAFVNVNVRPYYAEGSKTLGFEIAEQLGFELPDRVVVPVASGSLSRASRGASTSGAASASSRATAGDERGPGAGLLARGQRVCGRPGSLPACTSTRSPSRWRSATPPTGPTRSSRPPLGRLGGLGLRRGDPRGDPSAAETTGIFTETAGGVTTAVLRELAERGEIGSDERVVLVITGDGLKTLDAVRGTFEMHEVDPTIESVTDTVEHRAGRSGGCPNSRPMSVTVKIPTQLRSVTGGEGETTVEGSTVGAGVRRPLRALRRPAGADRGGR